MTPDKNDCIPEQFIFEQVKSVHQLKGSNGNIGSKAIELVAEKLDQSAKAKILAINSSLWFDLRLFHY